MFGTRAPDFPLIVPRGKKEKTPSLAPGEVDLGFRVQGLGFGVSSLDAEFGEAESRKLEAF